MKTFIGVIGVFSLLVSLGTFINGISIYMESTTIMQQGVAMQVIEYSALLLIAGIAGIAYGNSDTDVIEGKLSQIIDKLNK